MLSAHCEPSTMLNTEPMKVFLQSTLPPGDKKIETGKAGYAEAQAQHRVALEKRGSSSGSGDESRLLG